MEKIKIGFIGAGNMARALIGGLISSGVPASNIASYDPDQTRLSALCRDTATIPSSGNQHLVEQSQVVVLAVKPQAMHSVIADLNLPAQPPLFLSIAAGLRTDTLCNWFGQRVPLVRAMPNTPALVRAGATGLFANPGVSVKQRDIAETIMRAVGVTLWLEQEDQLDAVTALSGSGPAYFFYMMEAMETAGSRLGLSAEAARLLTVQTAFGAAKLALEVEEAPQVLRERVTSPGGTTEQALKTLDQSHTRDNIMAAVSAARDRSEELAKQLEQSS
ncbi:MAG: pyrroline-5-carboxylate reductase [Gammaproteobacteria bacterium]